MHILFELCFPIRYSPLFAVRYSRLFAVRDYSLFATIRCSRLFAIRYSLFASRVDLKEVLDRSWPAAGNYWKKWQTRNELFIRVNCEDSSAWKFRLRRQSLTPKLQFEITYSKFFWRQTNFWVRILSWISSWIFVLDFRVRISSWIFLFELNFRVGFSSYSDLELDFRVTMLSRFSRDGYQ